MKKCRYCGKDLDSNLVFCSNECENSYRKIIENDRHKIKYFILGITVVLFPFTTPETIALFGNKKSRFIGRILGMLLIAVGIWVGFI